MKKILVVVITTIAVLLIATAFDLVLAWLFTWLWNTVARPTWHIQYWETFVFLCAISVASYHTQGKKK